MHKITNTLLFYDTQADFDAGVPTKVSAVQYSTDANGAIDYDSAKTVLLEGNAVKADSEVKALAVKMVENVDRLKLANVAIDPIGDDSKGP